jgi:hypothetical protein
VLATLFFVTSLGLAFLSGQTPVSVSVMEDVPNAAIEETLPSIQPGAQDKAMDLPAVPEQDSAEPPKDELPEPKPKD